MGGEQEQDQYALITGFEPRTKAIPPGSLFLATFSASNFLIQQSSVPLTIMSFFMPKGIKPIYPLPHVSNTPEIPVEYVPVLNIVPALHQTTITNDVAAPRSYKYFFHVGVGNRDGVKVETIAHRTGYYKPDNQNFIPPGGNVVGYEDHQNLYQTKIDVEALVKHFKTKTSKDGIALSRDAGRYLCEFIYYVSMAEGYKTDDKVVLFVHVPPEGEPYSIEESREIIQEIITWVVTHY
ncbi:hypothetical protein BC936DRAFT_142106 [Jimgerdemannia flammicorona]|uniref:Peptidase C15, pyroglutamyl peptidase I-like protein n=1 Tax=Jimgerdemannia flammicorona TaxID=994334 RepID=A0A433DFK2_9FUNG|nr:hypothetical protein BC936DRAFT_142106 [Jimgerdemannia flammicorona]